MRTCRCWTPDEDAAIIFVQRSRFRTPVGLAARIERSYAAVLKRASRIGAVRLRISPRSRPHAGNHS